MDGCASPYSSVPSSRPALANEAIPIGIASPSPANSIATNLPSRCNSTGDPAGKLVTQFVAANSPSESKCVNSSQVTVRRSFWFGHPGIVKRQLLPLVATRQKTDRPENTAVHHLLPCLP